MHAYDDPKHPPVCTPSMGDCYHGAWALTVTQWGGRVEHYTGCARHIDALRDYHLQRPTVRRSAVLIMEGREGVGNGIIR